MMTDRLYYSDAYLRDFSATVLAVSDDARRVYLDRTAFYPTSGGQPHDLGTLGDAIIVDVLDEDAQIAHVVAKATALVVGQALTGHVQWTRRFDLMQQHTGQHLLSAMFADEYGWPTVSVHFGDDTSTLDIASPSVSPDTLREAELRANALVVENREISVTFEDAALATGLRKASERSGVLRVVSIAGLDRSACGGTHVRRTGEIGSIQLRGAERTKQHIRIEFLCGGRAVARARHDATLLSNTARLFSAAVTDVPVLAEQLQARVVELERDRKRLVTDLALFDARARWAATTPDNHGLRRFHVVLTDGAVREQESLAHALTVLGPCIVLVTSASPLGVLFAAADGIGIDAGQTLRAVLSAVGGRGGGSARLAQGSVPDVTALENVARQLEVVTSS